MSAKFLKNEEVMFTDSENGRWISGLGLSMKFTRTT